MASKKIKMEKDDDNNDQESKPTNSALNPVVVDEVKTRSQTDEGTGLEPDGSEKQQAQQQPVSATRPTTNSQASSDQLSPRSDIDQPGSSSDSASNPDPLHQLQPHHGSLNQPESSSKPVIDPAAANEFLLHMDSLNLPGVLNSPLGRLKLRSLINELGSVTISPDAGDGTHKRGRSTSTNVFHSRASQHGENKGDYDNAKVPSDLLPPTGKVDSTNVFHGLGDYRSQIQYINAEINLRQTVSEENMQEMITSVDRLPSTGIVIHEGGGSTSSNALLSGAQDGENKGDSDNAKPPCVLQAQGTGSGPGSTPGNTTAGDESNRPVSIAAGEVLSATDTDMLESTTESEEIQGEKEKSDAFQDGNTPGNSSAR
uniref:Uncharacterized protein n=1 Tax=Chenopodium quinoa TaxID=63459 RepID=A0A803M931_CHEQI